MNQSIKTHVERMKDLFVIGLFMLEVSGQSPQLSDKK